MDVLRRDRDFRRLWTGQSISVAGSQVGAVALPLVATLTLHAGAAGVSAVATAAYLPNVVIPLLAGHWLQSRRRRPAMIAADIIRALALATVPIAYLIGRESLPLLVVVALVVGCASVVFDVGSFTHIPSLVRSADLPAANRAMQGSATAAQVAGPGAAGLLVGALGPAVTVLVDAVSYLASATGIGRIRRPEPPPIADETGAGVFEGLRQLAANPVLRALATHAATFNAAEQILTVNLIVYAIDDRGLTTAQYGLALSAAGAGALVGTLVALAGASRFGFGRAFVGSLALSTGVPVLLAVPTAHGAAFAIMVAAIEFVSGIGLGSANVLSVTLRQVVVPTGSLARSIGGYRLVIFGAIPIGSLLGGVIGTTPGPRAGVLCGGFGIGLSALPMVQRRIRSLREPEDAVPHVVAESSSRPIACRS